MLKANQIVLFLFLGYSLSAQKIDSLQNLSFFRGQITATNNGISLIPNYSLNKPAAMFDLSMGKNRFSFDPMLRFGMDGKPWTFVFWLRYKLINQKKFSLGLGAHPSLLFSTQTATINGVNQEILSTQRYVAWEAAPTYQLNNKVALGIYYLGSHGLTHDLVQLGTFISAKAVISNQNIGKNLMGSFSPQLYYLRQDSRQGMYYTAALGLAKKDFPISINFIVSQAIKTDIIGKNFLWSVGFVYNINNWYLPKKQNG